MSVFLLAVTTTVLPMEQEKPNTTQPLTIIQSSLGSYSGILSDGLNYVSECVATSFDSLSNTITNQMSDEAAFKKLGYPGRDKTSREEITKFQSVYQRRQKMIGKAYPERVNDDAFISRRVQYIQRVLYALHNNTIANSTDRPKLALHCIQYHQQILNPLDTEELKYFITAEQEKIKQHTKKVDEDAKKLPITFNNSEALKEFVDQQMREKEEQKRKEEEERKRKEEEDKQKAEEARKKLEQGQQ